MTLRVAQTEVHKLLLDVRRLERVINSDEFANLFATLKSVEQITITELIRACKFNELLVWYEQRIANTPSIRELRVIASRLKIPRYALMTKIELVKAITQQKDILYGQTRSRSDIGEIVQVESNTLAIA